MGGRGVKEQKGRNYPAVPYLELVLYKVKCNVPQAIHSVLCQRIVHHFTSSTHSLTHSNRPIYHSVR